MFRDRPFRNKLHQDPVPLFAERILDLVLHHSVVGEDMYHILSEKNNQKYTRSIYNCPWDMVDVERVFSILPPS